MSKSLKFLSEIFLLLHCEKNSDGTKNLVLQGNSLVLRNQRRLRDHDMKIICQFLHKYNEIDTLNLAYNDIGDVGIEILVDEYLILKKNLLYLNLAYNNITKDGINYLCRELPESSVRELRLNGNKIGTEGGQELALFLNENKSVEFLDIAETDQTLSSIAYYMKILNNEQGLNKTIKVLDISRIIPCFNRYNYNDEHLADCISLLLQSNKSLVELHLQKCQFDGHDIEEIVKGLARNQTLLFLDIGYNRIGDYGIEIIAKYLKKRPPLLGLNVAANGIQDTGVRALSFFMPYSRIRLLDIGHNKISASGIVDLLNTIKKPVQIRILNMWGNRFNHASNLIIKRMFMSGALNQEFVDVCIYEVDGVLHAAYNPSDRYKHKYYCELDYACAVRLKIKRNYIPPDAKNKVDFKFYPTVPGYTPIERKKHDWKCLCCQCTY